MDLAALDGDLILTLGIAIAIFAIPAAVSAYSDARPPRAAAAGLLLSGGLVVLAYYATPGGYRLEDIPEAIARTIGRVLNS